MNSNSIVEMSEDDLADQIHPILVEVAARGRTITYSALCARLPGKWHSRSPLIHTALKKLVYRCRARNKPVVSAVVLDSALRRPAESYFEAAHPEVTDPFERQGRWTAELKSLHSFYAVS